MDTALPQKISFILDRNLAKANCTENHVCTSCDKVVLGSYLNNQRGARMDVKQLIFFHEMEVSMQRPTVS